MSNRSSSHFSFLLHDTQLQYHIVFALFILIGSLAGKCREYRYHISLLHLYLSHGGNSQFSFLLHNTQLQHHIVFALFILIGSLASKCHEYRFFFFICMFINITSIKLSIFISSPRHPTAISYCIHTLHFYLVL